MALCDTLLSCRVVQPLLRVPPAVSSTGLIQTAGLFTAGKFEVVARFPPVQGVVSSVWGFHFEEHFEKYASEDPQFLSDLNTHGATLTNHEIDMEIPASCSGMCTDGACCHHFPFAAVTSLTLLCVQAVVLESSTP